MSFLTSNTCLFNFQESDEDDGEDDVIIESEEEELDSGYDEFTWITKNTSRY